MRFKPKRSLDRKMFRKTAQKSKGINVIPLRSRGGIRQ